MRILLPIVLFALVAPLRADFVDSLSAAERDQLGISRLTTEERTRLNAAVEAYRRQGEIAAATAAGERGTEGLPYRARLKGKFRGWSGGTVFEFEDGQVWKQVGTDQYVLPASTAPELEIIESQHGHHRLTLKDGAWVNVKRLK